MDEQSCQARASPGGIIDLSGETGYHNITMQIDLSTLSLDQLKRAVALKEQIAALESELAGVLGASKPAAVAAPAPGKRSLSDATKAKMRAAHQARWAKIRAAKGTPAPAKIAPKAQAKRKMSAAGRARLVAAVKARWAKVKAAGKGKL